MPSTLKPVTNLGTLISDGSCSLLGSVISLPGFNEKKRNMQSTQIRQQSPEAPQIPAAALRDNLTRELKKLGKREKFVWAFVALVCIAIKIPGIWGGRFWAEEGGVFFLNAWNMPWYKALLYSHGGYLNLIGNLAGVLAHYLVPLKYACFVSTITALIIQACPLLIVCFSRATWLQGRKYYIAAMLLIFLNPFSGEVWLNTVASQYHLNLCTAMILSLPVEVGFAALFSRALLALAVLSGPGTYLLLPLFMLRGALNRVRERLIQVSILLTCVLIQLYFFCHPEARVLNAPNASSMFGIDPLLLADIFFLKHFAGPILGFQKSCLSFGTWFIDYRAGHFDLWPAAIVAVGVFLLFGYMVSKSRLIETKWLFI